MTNRIPPVESSQFFSRLTPTEFEELCYDLVSRLGFEQVSWRKGSGGEHSPSDGSRDIEAYWPIDEPDGFKDRQLWLIDAKHVTSPQALGKSKVVDFLSLRVIYPNAKLLIMTSGYISNSLKDSIKEIGVEKIRVWERHQIIAFVTKYHELLHKFDLSQHLNYLTQIHPLHVIWMREVAFTTDKMVEMVLEMGKKINKETIDHMAFEFSGIANLGQLDEVDLMEKYRELKQVSQQIAGRTVIDRFFNISLRSCDGTKQEWQRSVFQEMITKHSDWEDGHPGEMLNNLDNRLKIARLKYVRSCELILPCLFELYNAELENLKTNDRII